MKKEDADLLVAALRSGRYKQGKTYLRNLKDEFCCLGVYATEKGVKPVFDNNSESWVFGELDCSLDQSLNLGLNRFGDFSAEADLSMISNLSELDPPHNLAGLNDRSVPFNEIADFIEKNWEYIYCL